LIHVSGVVTFGLIATLTTDCLGVASFKTFSNDLY